MDEFSRTAVTPFRRLHYAEKTSRGKSSLNRSKEAKMRSKWFDGIDSNVSKRSKGNLNTAERSQSSHSYTLKRSAQESQNALERSLHSNAEPENLESRYSSDEKNTIQLNQSSERELPSQDSEISTEGNSPEEHALSVNEQSDESESGALKKPVRNRAFPKKLAGDGVKRLKALATKKDSSWRQNSRSRRLVANARERSRIHILSDAFENLRKAVPSYSQDQKLSKLAILKLATYYISALANLAESDTSARSLKQFAECVTHCTKALQTEGRSRRKQF